MFYNSPTVFPICHWLLRYDNFLFVFPTVVPGLKLSLLCLLAPPLRLMSAFRWQVARQHILKHYGKLEEFGTLVTEVVPELLSSRQRTQLLLGLRARVCEVEMQRILIKYRQLQLTISMFSPGAASNMSTSFFSWFWSCDSGRAPCPSSLTWTKSIC